MSGDEGENRARRVPVRVGVRSAMVALAVSAWLSVFAGPALRTAEAQSQSLATAQRVILGKVLTTTGAPIQGAIVYLKNTKSLEVRTYISTQDGSYRFGQLSTESDFTLWAESGGKKSKEKGISSFDTKKQFDIDLKIDMNK